MNEYIDLYLLIYPFIVVYRPKHLVVNLKVHPFESLLDQ